MIDYHLEGLTLVYFRREMEGSIGEMRTRISEQIDMKHVVKSIKFIGEYDKKSQKYAFNRN